MPRDPPSVSPPTLAAMSRLAAYPDPGPLVREFESYADIEFELANARLEIKALRHALAHAHAMAGTDDLVRVAEDQHKARENALLAERDALRETVEEYVGHLLWRDWRCTP